MLNERESLRLTDDEIAYLAGAMFGAGSDTVSTTSVITHHRMGLQPRPTDGISTQHRDHGSGTPSRSPGARSSAARQGCWTRKTSATLLSAHCRMLNPGCVPPLHSAVLRRREVSARSDRVLPGGGAMAPSGPLRLVRTLHSKPRASRSPCPTGFAHRAMKDIVWVRPSLP